MDYDPSKWQYRVMASVYHGPKFGHYLEMEVALKGRPDVKRTGLGTWTGVGVPEKVLRTSSGILVAAWEEHLVTRYGCREELELGWKVEPPPF